jgi:hypothetical protein
VIVSSSWTAERSVAMRFGRPQSMLYLTLLTRHQIQSASERLRLSGTVEVCALMLAYPERENVSSYVCMYVIHSFPYLSKSGGDGDHQSQKGYVSLVILRLIKLYPVCVYCLYMTCLCVYVLIVL